jgi:hypothetical protein
MYLPIVTGATANSAVPSAATAGVSIWRGRGEPRQLDLGLLDTCNTANIVVWSTAGTGVLTVTVRLWFYSSHTGKWHPFGAGADGTKGTINAGNAMGETDADIVAHTEVIKDFQGFDRVYAQILAIGGTSTAISVAFVAK